MGALTDLELQQHKALTGTVTAKGHLPWCNHGAWVGGYNNRRLHPCDLPGCSGEGCPCIPRCLAVRQALRAAEGLTERQGALL